MKRQLIATDENAMMAYAGRLAASWLQCDTCNMSAALTVFLRGDLGAGKTTFTRGFVRACGYEGAVKSPTYTLLESYEIAGKTIYHFDLYRLCDAEELEFTGARDCFADAAICLVEWPEKAEAELPQADIECSIQIDGDSRLLQLQSHTVAGNEILLQSFPD